MGVWDACERALALHMSMSLYTLARMHALCNSLLCARVCQNNVKTHNCGTEDVSGRPGRPWACTSSVHAYVSVYSGQNICSMKQIIMLTRVLKLHKNIYVWARTHSQASRTPADVH